jgi:hypothetical protein
MEDSLKEFGKSVKVDSDTGIASHLKKISRVPYSSCNQSNVCTSYFHGSDLGLVQILDDSGEARVIGGVMESERNNIVKRKIKQKCIRQRKI